MHELPALFLSAQQSSVLGLAVRAVAFADMGSEGTGDISFRTKARQHYGSALNGMRTIVNDWQELSSDHVLLAMLLVDNFEVR